jgi:molecular chaperone DnaK
LSRGDFERMTSDLMQRTRDTTELVMQQAGISPGEFDDVILVGGSTYMPVVESMLRGVTGNEPTRKVIPEEAVAQGAAIHAAILEAKEVGLETKMTKGIVKRLKAVSTIDVNSHSLGVKISDPNVRDRKINHIMIPKNTGLPYKVTQRFVTTSPNQQRIHVCVLEGEASDPDACTTIGDFRVFDLPPNLPAGSPVEVTYLYDKNGRIHAEAKELTSDKAADIAIVRAQGLDTGGVDNFEKLAQEYTVEELIG